MSGPAAPNPGAPAAPSRPAAHARPAALLPPAPKSDRPLFLVVAIIVALAAVAAIAARAAWSASAAWTADLEGSMTVEVRPADGETAEDAALRAAAALSSTAGVGAARALTRQEIDALLAPWFGEAGAPADAPLPGLVDIRVDRVAPAQPNDLLAALDAAGIAAEVDDHERWAADIRRAAGAVRTLAFAAFLALAAAAAAVISFATRASLAARSDVVEVLHLVGAKDDFIAGEFTRRFLSLGFRAGLLGAVLAGLAGVAGMLLTQGGADDFFPRFRFAILDAIILALAPLAAAGAAALTARETVRGALARLY